MLAVLLLGTFAQGAAAVAVPGLGSLQGASIVGGGSVPVTAFLGIPYARPPVGSLRWAEPRDPEPWGARDATSFGAACPASACGDKAANYSEDCLFLNVFRPEGVATDAQLPVMVFIHGGTFVHGCSNDWAMHQVVAASVKRGRPVVGVSVNYRLGMFGFLGSEELRVPGQSTGTYGLLDQRKSLEFVNAYISVFGGNPNDVTIYGQSAGAASVTSHLVMAGSYNKTYTNGKLFHKAIAHSGLGAIWSAKEMSHAEDVFAKTKALLGCADVACMRGKTTDEITALMPSFPSYGLDVDRLPFSPAVDGVELTGQPRTLISEGKHARVPLVAGVTRDETAIFILDLDLVPKDATEAQFDAMIGKFVPQEQKQEYLAKLKEAYSPDNYQYPSDLAGRSFWWWAIMRSYSDHEFTCPTRRAAHAFSMHSEVYTYLFLHPTKSSTFLDTSGPDAFTAPHESDLPYMFNCSHLYTNCAFTNAEEAALADKLVSYWAQFGAEGVLPAPWVRQSASTDHLLLLDTPSAGGLSVATNFRGPQCDLWDTIIDLVPDPILLAGSPFM